MSLIVWVSTEYDFLWARHCDVCVFDVFLHHWRFVLYADGSMRLEIHLLIGDFAVYTFRVTCAAFLMLSAWDITRFWWCNWPVRIFLNSSSPLSLLERYRKVTQIKAFFQVRECHQGLVTKLKGQFSLCRFENLGGIWELSGRYAGGIPKSMS